MLVAANSEKGVYHGAAHVSDFLLASTAGSALEVPADLVRLSVGIETVEDLLADLAHALS